MTMTLGHVANLWFIRPAITAAIAVEMRDRLDIPVAWTPKHPFRSQARGTILYYRRDDGDRLREHLRGSVPDCVLTGEGEPQWARFRPIIHRWEIENFFDLLAWHEIQ